jgi:hypothetical protein
VLLGVLGSSLAPSFEHHGSRLPAASGRVVLPEAENRDRGAQPARVDT